MLYILMMWEGCSTPYIVYMVLLICGIASMYTTYRFGKSELRWAIPAWCA